MRTAPGITRGSIARLTPATSLGRSTTSTVSTIKNENKLLRKLVPFLLALALGTVACRAATPTAQTSSQAARQPPDSAAVDPGVPADKPFDRNDQFLTFDPEIAVGDLLTAFAILVSIAGLLIAFHKERALRKKEHADRVRQAAALVVAKLDRWKQLSLQLFDELHVAATDADAMMVDDVDETGRRKAFETRQRETRDFFWKKTVEAQGQVAQRILDEEIELAYSNLYGYDPKIHKLFTGAVQRLREVDGSILVQVLNRTQADILSMEASADGKVASSQLGNRLRLTLARSKNTLDRYAEPILAAFRDGMLPIVRASDESLTERRVPVPSPDILPAAPDLKTDKFSGTSGRPYTCRFIFDSLTQSEREDISDPWPLGIGFPEHKGDGDLLEEHAPQSSTCDDK